MNSYLTIVNRYLSAHKKKTRLTMISIAISVALVTGIFSMLDVFLQFEKMQVINDIGNYHVLLQDPLEKEMQSISSRIDVQNAGRWIDYGKGSINDITCKMGALEEKFKDNFNTKVIEGRYPTKKNEIMIEQWAAESIYLNKKVNDTIKITFNEDNIEREFVISGIYNDFAHMKAEGVPALLLSTDSINEIANYKDVYFVEFKKRVNVSKAVEDIKNQLNIDDNRAVLNEHLLAVIGQSKNDAAIWIYSTGAFLFCIVLLAGVVMIYNTFNISVMERVRQFGLLRCVGASQSQIKKLVKREGLIVTLKAIPIGILTGMVITFICSAILKFYNDDLFGDVSVFNISLIGIAAGIVVGFLTVFIASSLPAKKAARVSPVNAVTGSNDIKTKKVKKKGLLTKMFHADIAMGINNATIKKKTLFLMSCSIAISIIMFLGFNVFVDFLHTSLKTTKPYTPDISLISEQGLDNDLYTELADIKGVKRVYGRMFGYANATFDAERLTDTYIEMMNGIEVKDDGLFIPPEKSCLISYDKNQLKWAKVDLIAGELSEDKMNAHNGVIAVARQLRKNIGTHTTNLQVGDAIYIETPTGTKELTVMGILRTVPFSDSELNLTTFITTEKLFTELTGESEFKAIDIQLNSRKDEKTADKIKGMVDDSITYLDARQKNTDVSQTFFTMALFIYGFVAIIALISILNILNTMNTSVATKTRYLGVMRAVGMSGTQLDKMVLAEAATYSVVGCITGCILGIMLHKSLIENLAATYAIVWKFPLVQIIFIIIITTVVTVLSVIRPLKRIKAKAVSEVVNSL